MVGGELCTDQIWCENFTNKTLQSNNGGETFQARLHRHKYQIIWKAFFNKNVLGNEFQLIKEMNQTSFLTLHVSVQGLG